MDTVWSSHSRARIECIVDRVVVLPPLPVDNNMADVVNDDEEDDVSMVDEDDDGITIEQRDFVSLFNNVEMNVGITVGGGCINGYEL